MSETVDAASRTWLDGRNRNRNSHTPHNARNTHRMGKNKRGSGSSRKPSGSSGVGGAGSFGKCL